MRETYDATHAAEHARYIDARYNPLMLRLPTKFATGCPLFPSAASQPSVECDWPASLGPPPRTIPTDVAEMTKEERRAYIKAEAQR